MSHRIGRSRGFKPGFQRDRRVPFRERRSEGDGRAKSRSRSKSRSPSRGDRDRKKGIGSNNLKLQGARIFVGGLNETVSKEQVEDRFNKYGAIIGVSLQRNFAFVQYADEESAERAVDNENGALFKGSKLDVNFARASQRMKERCAHIVDKSRKNLEAILGAENSKSERSKAARDPFDPDRNNDCEIIVLDKHLRKYAEEVERKLKLMNLYVDLLFPSEHAQLPNVLSDISSRGALYAIVINTQNEVHRSVTLNILYGTPQEHRNMPLDDALSFIADKFEVYVRSSHNHVSTPRSAGQANKDKHPDNIVMLLTCLTECRPLTLLQYDCLITYLKDKRDSLLRSMDRQCGPSLSTSNPDKFTEDALVEKEVGLHNKISHLLNSPCSTGGRLAKPADTAAVSAPHPLPISSMGSYWNDLNANRPGPVPGPGQNPCPGQTGPLLPSSLNLNNPVVQRALESLIQTGSNLLRPSNPSNNNYMVNPRPPERPPQFPPGNRHNFDFNAAPNRFNYPPQSGPQFQFSGQFPHRF